MVGSPAVDEPSEKLGVPKSGMVLLQYQEIIRQGYVLCNVLVLL